MVKSRSRNANYDFDKQKDPKKPMGQGDYANMPSRPMMVPYGQPEDYRDGLVNSFNANIRITSDICENER